MKDPEHAARRDETGMIKAILGVAAIGIFFVIMLATIGLLAFSVRVEGHSMEPTLHDGDRLEVNLLGRNDVKRFDIVQTVEPGTEGFQNGTQIVKRVIGMPGDQVAVRSGGQPSVMLKLSDGTTYTVTSQSWTEQPGNGTEACCSKLGGRVTASKGWKWATVPDGAYWVIGDNWGGSTDSRKFGWVPAENISGTIWFRLTPLGTWGSLPNPVVMVPLS